MKGIYAIRIPVADTWPRIQHIESYIYIYIHIYIYIYPVDPAFPSPTCPTWRPRSSLDLIYRKLRTACIHGIPPRYACSWEPRSPPPSASPRRTSPTWRRSSSSATSLRCCRSSPSDGSTQQRSSRYSLETLTQRLMYHTTPCLECVVLRVYPCLRAAAGDVDATIDVSHDTHDTPP